MKFFTFISFFILTFLCILSDNDDEKECEESSVCSPSESCESYQLKLVQIQQARNAETKRELFSNLRCNINDNFAYKHILPL